MLKNNETAKRVLARCRVQRLHPTEHVLICPFLDHGVESARRLARGRFDTGAESILLGPGVALALTTWRSRRKDEIYN